MTSDEIIERAHASQLTGIARRHGLNVDDLRPLYNRHRARLEEGSRFHHYVPILAASATEEDIVRRKEASEKSY